MILPIILTIALVLIILIIYLFVFRWSVSVPDYMAARHYRFGKPSSDTPISGKRVIVIPYIDHLVMIDQRIQKNTLDGISVLTKERQIMKVSATLIWKSENAAMTIENIKPEDIEPTFFKIIESVIKNECSKMCVDEILENRTKLSKNLSEILKETADNWGLSISSVNITNLVVANDRFMKNMALPKEIEIERKAKLAEIQKELEVELKAIEKDTQSKLASLESEKTVGEEKEKVALILDKAEKERIRESEELQKAIELVLAEQKKIKADIAIRNTSEEIKAKLLAEANGLEERIKVLTKYNNSGLNYELIEKLPEIYKNLNMGDVTLFMNDGENNGVLGSGYGLTSLLSVIQPQLAKNINVNEKTADKVVNDNLDSAEQ